MVDTYALGAYAVMRVGSNPIGATFNYFINYEILTKDILHQDA